MAVVDFKIGRNLYQAQHFDSYKLSSGVCEIKEKKGNQVDFMHALF